MNTLLLILEDMLLLLAIAFIILALLFSQTDVGISNPADFTIASIATAIWATATAHQANQMRKEHT